jgi:tetratricopeptide (TPR) repeat protein
LDPARAVDYLCRAGDRALSQLAPDEAVGYFGQALELVAVTPARDEARNLELLISLGRAQRSAGEAAHRATLLAAAKAAQQLGDVDALARAALENIRGSIFSTTGAVDEERVAVLEIALHALPADKEAIRARLLAALGLELHFDTDRMRRIAVSDEAVVLARRSGDPAALAYVLAARYYTILAPGTVEERRADTQELLTLADTVADPVVTAWAHWLSWRLAMETARIDEAKHHHQRLEDLAGGLGQPTLAWGALAIQASTLLLAGHLTEAERLAAAAVALGEGNQPDAALVFATQLFGVRYEQGRLDEVRPSWLAEAQRSRLPLTRAVLAVIESELGLADEGRRRLDELGTNGFEDVALDEFWLLTLSCAAAATVGIGQRHLARRLYDLLEPFADQVAGVGELWVGSVGHYLACLAGALGRYKDAERHFVAAAATHDRIGAPAWLARTHLEWARMLLTRHQPGDAAQARELLGRALATAQELGLANVERRAVELLE